MCGKRKHPADFEHCKGQPTRRCLTCKRKRDVDYYARNNAVIKKKRKRRRKARGDLQRSMWRAKQIVRRAVNAGILERGRCAVCGDDCVDAHHEDYSRPLAVAWLCRRHHREIHENNERGIK